MSTQISPRVDNMKNWIETVCALLTRWFAEFSFASECLLLLRVDTAWVYQVQSCSYMQKVHRGVEALLLLFIWEMLLFKMESYLFLSNLISILHCAYLVKIFAKITVIYLFKIFCCLPCCSQDKPHSLQGPKLYL